MSDISVFTSFVNIDKTNTENDCARAFEYVEDYARRWIKREVDQDPELESLSDWVRTIRSLVQGRIHKLKNCVNSRPKSVFKDQEAVKCLSSL